MMSRSRALAPRNSVYSLIALAAALASGEASAQITDGVVKIGILTDMSSRRRHRPRLGRRGEARGRGLQSIRQGHEGRDRGCRPPE
jgi:hypothetical protein